MSHSTSLSVEAIHAQAQKHKDTGEDIKLQLQQLKQRVEETLARSNNGATKALNETCEAWINSLQRNVLAHLDAMADNIVRESNNQQGTDEESNQAIINIPMITGSFLGGV